MSMKNREDVGDFYLVDVLACLFIDEQVLTYLNLVANIQGVWIMICVP